MDHQGSSVEGFQNSRRVDRQTSYDGKRPSGWVMLNFLNRILINFIVSLLISVSDPISSNLDALLPTLGGFYSAKLQIYLLIPAQL